MKIIGVKELEIPEVKIITYQRFKDERGYFTETYRKNEFESNPQTSFLKGIDFTQVNESFSKKMVFRGFHFQWNPFMAKMLRVIKGNVVDMAIDIRPSSTTFGKAVGHELKTDSEQENSEWIWVPVGFAHAVLFLEDSTIEYFCTGQWAPDTERCISPRSKDIDWSLLNKDLKTRVDEVMSGSLILQDKDKNGLTLEDWKVSEDSKKFI